MPAKKLDSAALDKAAGVALYQAKRGGRDRVVMCAKKAGQFASQSS